MFHLQTTVPNGILECQRLNKRYLDALEPKYTLKRIAEFRVIFKR